MITYIDEPEQLVPVAGKRQPGTKTLFKNMRLLDRNTAAAINIYRAANKQIAVRSLRWNENCFAVLGHVLYRSAAGDPTLAKTEITDSELFSKGKRTSVLHCRYNADPVRREQLADIAAAVTCIYAGIDPGASGVLPTIRDAGPISCRGANESAAAYIDAAGDSGHLSAVGLGQSSPTRTNFVAFNAPNVVDAESCLGGSTIRIGESNHALSAIDLTVAYGHDPTKEQGVSTLLARTLFMQDLVMLDQLSAG